MNSFDRFLRWALSILVVCTMAFALGACDGDDGRDGAAGAAGPAGATGADGPPGPGASTTPLESCGVCHDGGSFASAPAAHALDPIEMVSNVAFAPNGDDLDVTFNLAVDGAPGLGYDEIQRGYRQNGTDSASISGDLSALTDNNDGSYSFTITDGDLVAGDNRYLFRVAMSNDDPEDPVTPVYFYGDFPASPFEPVEVSAEACANCHGPEGIDVHQGYYAAVDGAEPCLVCHGGPAPWSGAPVASLEEVAHKYHSSIWEDDGEAVHITYPTYMNNCSVCHDTVDSLAAVNAMPFTAGGCFNCHGSIATIPFEDPGIEALHAGIDETTDCMTGCHMAGGLASDVLAVTDVHNGAETARHGFIVDGVDTSVTEGAKFVWEITGIVDDGTNLAISWQASYDGVGVDPCNAVAGAGAPVFHGDDDGNLSMLRSYAQGDDFILGQSTSAPGQALNVGVDNVNTACAAGIATTTIPVDAVTAERGIVALQGKPRFVSTLDPTVLWEARAVTPTYEWLVGDGSAPLETRRDIVDTGECLKCHVGSLYQHGGNRVDNVDMCILCHNSASNEQNVRVGLGVDPSEAYDGQVGETYEMKTMLHRIHAAGVEGLPPYVIYRNRGIYGFATDDSLLPNWPGTGAQIVYGSDADAVINHNFHSATYPRSLNECTACHTEDVTEMPDQTQAMATTTGAGSEEWMNQLDDTLQGASTTACVTCHADGASKGHAFQNSWTPQEFAEGRQTIIDAAN